MKLSCYMQSITIKINSYNQSATTNSKNQGKKRN